jgi:ribosome-associated toxin RatA of RatAB toxin-antitoxin module
MEEAVASAERTETVDVPLKSFYRAVADYESYPQFVTGMKSAKLVGEEGGAKKVHFDLDMMKRVQYTVRLTDKFDEGAGEAAVAWTLDSSEFFKVNNGTWTLKALGPAKTQVTYKLELEFSFPVPGFVLKGLVAKGLPAAINEFAKRAREVA